MKNAATVLLLSFVFCNGAAQKRGDKLRAYGFGAHGIYQYVSFWKRPISIKHNVSLGNNTFLDTNGYVRYPNGVTYRLRFLEIVAEGGGLTRRNRFGMHSGGLHEYTWDKTVKNVVEDVQLSNGDVLKTDGTIIHMDGSTDKLREQELISSDGERRMNEISSSDQNRHRKR